MIRVVIADDHHLVRQGLKLLLDAQADIKVIGEACNGQEAVDTVQLLKPDVLILDISMPIINGFEATKRIRSQNQSPYILILSMYSDESLIKKAYRIGANGYLLKNSIAEDMLNAVRKTYSGQYFISPELEKNINLEQLLSMLGEPVISDKLTAREREICQLIADGKSNQIISKQLHISIKTVEKHRANLMKKLGVNDVASLIRIAIQQALIVMERYGDENLQ